MRKRILFFFLLVMVSVLWYQFGDGALFWAMIKNEYLSTATEESVQSDSILSVESQWDYETILQKEACDENYVDEESGTLVLASAQTQLISLAETENAQIRKNAEAWQETEMATDSTPEETEKVDDNAKAVSGDKEQPATEDVWSGFEAPSQTAVHFDLQKLEDFDFVLHNFYTVDASTTITSSELHGKELYERNLKIAENVEQNTPQILIYHTHSHEMFVDSNPEELMSGVMGVGEYLTQILQEKYGLGVLHHMGQYDADGRDYAYSRAAEEIPQILAEHPQIEVVIDLHRDAVPEDVHMVRTVGGIEMAPVMFFNGLSRLAGKGKITYLENPYLEDNLAFSLQMKILADEYYPEWTRAIYLKGYRYNMHFCPKTLLVEVGAQTNTVEEAKNAMEPLADLLAKVLLP